MDQARLNHLKQYITSHDVHLERYMRPMINPAGKRLLVIGSGWGTETYWALTRGAKYVLGIDPAERPIQPLQEALRDKDASLNSMFEHRVSVLDDLHEDAGPFDAVISNNVFEHIFDLTGTLQACRRFMSKPGNRLHIFTDPLYYSSVGAHLPIQPWQHLKVDEDDLLRSLPEGANWTQFKTGLNKMTITDFLTAVREAGMWMERLSIVPDRNRKTYSAPSEIAPMDALLEGLSCTLAFPENI